MQIQPDVRQLWLELQLTGWTFLSKAPMTPPVLTTDFTYIRFIGDRSIDEKDSGKIQKDRQKGMEVWATEVRKVQKEISLAIVAANNHYAGFGPATANQFRVMLGQGYLAPLTVPNDGDASFFSYS
ncbi:MAG: DUF72 domain-containing protein [Nitrososphaera sp.]